MAIFRKLFSQIASKAEHPLASDATVAALLAEIPAQSPMRILQDTSEWLDDFARFSAEVPLPALLGAALQLDEFAFPARLALLERYFDPSQREHLSEVAWGDIERNVRLAMAAYRYCLEASAQQLGTGSPGIGQRKDMLLATVRALHAWTIRKKLLRFRYRIPEAADWREAHALLALAGKLGFAGDSIMAYPKQAEKLSPLQHYLVGVYLELAPLTNLTADQVEALDRVLLANAGSLELLTTAGPSSTHMIDVAGTSGPVPLGTSAPAEARWRYLSRSRLRPAIMKLAMEARQTDTVPKGLESCGLTLDQLRRLLKMLLLHWAEKPPQRANERHPGSEALMAVTSFDMVRRAVAYSDFVRAGRSIDYIGIDIEAEFETKRFGGKVALLDEPIAAEQIVCGGETVTPLDVLGSLELAGDRQMMEEWTLTDQSNTGVGVSAPGLRSRYQIGSLVGLRYADGIEWHLGIIRRIGRTASGTVSIGLSTLDWPSYIALVKPAGGEAAAQFRPWDTGHDHLDAILVTLHGDQLVLPVGTFVAELELLLRAHDGRRQVRLTELVERGRDFELVRFVVVG